MKKFLYIMVFALVFFLFTSCNDDHGLKPKEPVTLSLWHNYGGQMKETMDNMVDEFNETVGAEKGIILSVTSISSSAALHEKLMMIANGDPGAPEMPDITTANPKTALILAEKGLLANLDDLFTEKELSAYVPRFIEEGRLESDHLYVFPTAKSTEVLFLNRTAFDRFAAETGVTYEDLKTFEGIAKAAVLYYDWTDAKTPDVSGDGKAFYHADSLFNLAQVGCRQLDEDFIKDGMPEISSGAFQRFWHFYYDSAVKGHFAIFDGYASDLAKTGEILCSTGSTAGVLFFDPVITYPDNTTETAELMILPYPTFEGGKKIAMQRGSGMMVANTTETKRYAAGIFLKWFTSPENNLRFVSSTGYLPVTDEAFGDMMSKEIEQIDNQNIRTLLKTSIEMQKEYDFYIPPLFAGIDVLQDNFNNEIRQKATDSRAAYRSLLTEMAPDAAFEQVKTDFNMEKVIELNE
ncbi:extracellular solute-binding protein [Sinanaerobacter chloroacetimidivorans]|nr:extracellular solute-binding protein [Sinanaerobacter chloroacetimidivorans]